MNKLSETLKNILGKWKELSKSKKIAFSVLIISVMVAVIYISVALGKTKYGVLFKDLDNQDSGAIIAKLKEKKIEYKVANGSTILVPEEQADALRMELISEVPMTGGSVGWELFESGSMVATDFENNVKYQRALSGSVERMIESFEEVKEAKVNLVLPEKTVFIREEDPAKAAVVIKLKSGVNSLSDNQVKGIVALLTGSVDNLPKENVYVVVNGNNVVTDELLADEEEDRFSSDKQSEIRKQREKDLKQKILDVLEDIYGNGIKVAVNLDMNFDAMQTESITYEDGVIVSEQGTSNSTSNGDGFNSGSPIDNNMINSVDDSNSMNSSAENSSYTRNYNVPEKKQIHVEAPGKVEKMTVSVVVDENMGTLDGRTESKIRSLVANAVGFDPERGDAISVVGLDFKSDGQDIIDVTTKEMEKAQIYAEKEALAKQIGYGIGAIILLFVLLITMKKLNKKEEEEEIQGFDMVIGDNIDPKNEQAFNPIEFDVEDEKSFITKEVKKYAKEKPEQVAEIVKAWLAEDEG